MTDKNIDHTISLAGSKKSHPLKDNGIPGPGAYDTAYSTIRADHSRDKLSKDKRFKEYKSIGPGPGAYQQHNINHSQAAFILSKSKVSNPDNVPGPGTYEADFSKITQKKLSFKMGTSTKFVDYTKSAKNIPGPGQYETAKSTLTDTDHAPTFGIQRKIELGVDTKTPGPGNYDQKAYYRAFTHNEPKAIFGRQKRSQSTKNFAPGPGAYQLRGQLDQAVQKKKGFKISERTRTHSQFQKGLPGPGAYNTQSAANLYRHNVPAFTIGKQTKLKIQNFREIMSKPGPLSYNAKTSTLQHKFCIIGKDKRKGLGIQSNIPGPGTYDVKNLFKGNAYTLPKSQRKSMADDKIVPGPTAYNPKPILDSKYQNIGIGTDQRKTYETKLGPGPGDYYREQKSISNGFKFGNDKRSHEKDQKLPGPGQYDIPSTIANAPHYSSVKSK